MLHCEFSTKPSCKIVQIIAKILMVMSQVAQFYALMKFSNKSDEIVLLAFPRSTRMWVTGGMHNAVDYIHWYCIKLSTPVGYPQIMC